MPTDPKDYIGKQIKAIPYDENSKGSYVLMLAIVDSITHDIKGYLPIQAIDNGDGTATIQVTF